MGEMTFEPEYQAALDRQQDEAYDAFLTKMGLHHTESLWDAFVAVWADGFSWGIDARYTYVEGPLKLVMK